MTPQVRVYELATNSAIAQGLSDKEVVAYAEAAVAVWWDADGKEKSKPDYSSLAEFSS